MENSENSLSPEQEANQAALEAYEKADNPVDESIESPADDRPEWLPEKFDSVEDLAKSYKELEAKLGGDNETDTETTEDVEPVDDDTQSEEPTTDAIDVQSFTAEYEEAGELSEASYEKLQAAGIDRSIVDQYIAGVDALRNQITDSVLSEFGGKESYDAMSKWAEDNLSDAQLDAYNTQVSSGNIEVTRLAVSGLMAQYKKASGGLAQGFQTDNGSVGSSNNNYRSVAELQTDMASPRYKNDPAFRKEVASKLAKSNIF